MLNECVFHVLPDRADERKRRRVEKHSEEKASLQGNAVQAYKLPLKRGSAVFSLLATTLKGTDNVAMSSVNDSLKKVSILTGLIVIKSKDAESII